MDSTSTCPPWWPQLLWELDVRRRPGPSAAHMNYSPLIEDIMASMHVHAMSHLMTDQGAAAEIRTLAEQRLMHAADHLRMYQRESAVQSSPGSTAVPSVQATKEIDQATISQMRALASAHPVPPAVPKGPSAELRKGIDQATISQMRALAGARPAPRHAKHQR